jgi:hypothetical protein
MLKYLFRLLNRDRKGEPITIVSGLPRSGTSMMMKMLEAGGLPPLTDNIRIPDEDNPKGYYEFERVKKLRGGDLTWLADAQGKVVKVIAALLVYLPATYEYRIIFMRRAMPEILASQRAMLIHRGEDPNKISDEEMIKLFEKHLAQVDKWLDNQPTIKRIYVSYNQMLEEPASQIDRVNRFLGNKLDIQKMIQVVNPDLYRQRGDMLTISKKLPAPHPTEVKRP